MLGLKSALDVDLERYLKFNVQSIRKEIEESKAKVQRQITSKGGKVEKEKDQVSESQIQRNKLGIISPSKNQPE